MAAGSSLRGLSDVTTTTSARAAAIAPMAGRLVASRSPPQPNTTSTRPCRWPGGPPSGPRPGRRACGRSRRSRRRAGRRRPARTGRAPPGRPRARRPRWRRRCRAALAAVAAARALATLNPPPRRRRTPWPRQVKRAWSGATTTSWASAREYDSVGMVAASRRSWPWGSSRFTTASSPRSGWNRRALAAKYRASVCVEVEVVAAEVGEHGHGEARRVDAVHGQGVRRHLHRDGTPALVTEGRQPRLELGRLGRGVGPRERADDAGRPAGRLEHGGEEVRDGRLAVRAGDADDGEARRRVRRRRRRRAAPSPPACPPRSPGPRRGRATARRAGPRRRRRRRPAAKSCPSTRSPRRQQNSVPGPTGASRG